MKFVTISRTHLDVDMITHFNFQKEKAAQPDLENPSWSIPGTATLPILTIHFAGGALLKVQGDDAEKGYDLLTQTLNIA